jgi:hypothetical protein
MVAKNSSGRIHYDPKLFQALCPVQNTSIASNDHPPSSMTQQVVNVHLVVL